MKRSIIGHWLDLRMWMLAGRFLMRRWGRGRGPCCAKRTARSEARSRPDADIRRCARPAPCWIRLHIGLL